MHECHVRLNLGMSAKNANLSTGGLFMTTHQPIDVAIIGGALRAMLRPFMRRAPT